MCSMAFGYVRVLGSGSEQTCQSLHEELADYAEREGYTLAEVFIEQDEIGSSAFAALMEALKRGQARIVIVPTMQHFAHLPSLRVAMKVHIERETGARVVVIDAGTDDSVGTD